MVQCRDTYRRSEWHCDATGGSRCLICELCGNEAKLRFAFLFVEFDAVLTEFSFWKQDRADVEGPIGEAQTEVGNVLTQQGAGSPGGAPELGHENCEFGRYARSGRLKTRSYAQRAKVLGRWTLSEYRKTG